MNNFNVAFVAFMSSEAPLKEFVGKVTDRVESEETGRVRMGARDV